MKKLLDTHAFIWYVMGDPSLSNQAREIIDSRAELSFSIASLWEISIKINIGKLQLNCSYDDLLTRLAFINAEILLITIEDTQTYINLPLSSNHRDPFDRMLVSQAINYSLVLVSKDSKLDAYPIQRIWA
ncbi:type II toxin-antitoxin system VapC family toxin [Leptolyngbyaceae cyanobacterium UHCC 1019]